LSSKKRRGSHRRWTMRSPHGEFRKSLNFEKSLGERTEKKLLFTGKKLQVSRSSRT
jgi:hypothetical protein